MISPNEYERRGRRGMWDHSPLEREALAVAAQSGRNTLARYRARFAADAARDRAEADAEEAKWAELERWDREAVGQDDAWLDRIYDAYHRAVAAARTAHAETVAAAEAQYAAADAELTPRAQRLSDALVEGRHSTPRPVTTEESSR